MTKLLKKIRAILNALGTQAKLKFSVVLSVSHILRIEVDIETTLAPPDQSRPV